ncbi:ATP synthase F1 subunit gamma [Mycoplasmopsis primatum]|uniref:ATP synthase F1 subunit gamma n=1 Tax=Mycoplasmopsis primatum TaxID=55604 RepID=UPI0004976F7C|nr:ATP synthase F1 subunit gamma [Mycoplasmopsis primatum]
MASIQSIQNRIKTVNSIRKITHAMELVSFSKLKKAKNAYDEVAKYDLLIQETFKKIFENLYEDELQDLINSRSKNENKLYIIISSDLGLAGSYNSNIIRLSKSLIKPDDKIITIGSYAKKALNQSYPLQNMDFANHSYDKNKSQLVKKIVKKAFSLYNKNEIGSINIIYTKFINNLVQQEVCEKIFPFDEEQIKNYIDNHSKDYNLEFEPNPKNIIQEAIPLYVDSKIYLAIADAQISEQAARRIAMENATDNADSLINDLDMEFKRKRQAKITNEIIEIISGADAV